MKYISCEYGNISIRRTVDGKIMVYLNGVNVVLGGDSNISILSALVIAANHLLAMLKAEAEEGDKQ